MVEKPQEFPHVLHGLILTEFPDGTQGRGTGTLVNKSSVLSAAHVFYDPQFGGMASNVNFYLGMRNGKYLKKVPVTQYQLYDSYIKSLEEVKDDSADHDLAVAHLEEDIGSTVGWASIKVMKDSELFNLKVNVTGYPSIGKGPLAFSTYVMYTMEGPIKATSPYRLYYDIDTSGGQSGAGVWKLGYNNIVECTGVHAYGFSSKDSHLYNSATRINAVNFETIKKWIENAHVPN